MNKSIETQIAKALNIKIKKYHKYTPELYCFGLKDSTNLLVIHLDKSLVTLEDESGTKLREAKIIITLE